MKYTMERKVPLEITVEDAQRAVKAVLSWANKFDLCGHNSFVLEANYDTRSFFNAIIYKETGIEDFFMSSTDIIKDSALRGDRHKFATLLDEVVREAFGISYSQRPLNPLDYAIGSREVDVFLHSLPFTDAIIDIDYSEFLNRRLGLGREFIKTLDMSYKDRNKYVIGIDSFLNEIRSIVKEKTGEDLMSCERLKWVVGGFLHDTILGKNYSYSLDDETLARNTVRIEEIMPFVSAWRVDELLECSKSFIGYTVNKDNPNSYDLINLKDDTKQALKL